MSRARVFDYLYHGVYLTVYGLFKYIPSPLGDLARGLVLHAALRKCGRIRVYEGVTVWYPYRVRIGSQVTLNEHVYISGYGGVSIGDSVSIGHRTSILSSDHQFMNQTKRIKDQGIVGKPTVIGNDVFIGCNVTILMGVRIGNGAVIGAGSIVTRDVPEYTVVAGNPAKMIASRKEET